MTIPRRSGTLWNVSLVEEQLQAQLEYLRSDERLREQASRAAEMTVSERLQLTYRLCRVAMQMLDRTPPEVRERVEGFREPLGPDAETVLARFGSIASPGPT